MNYEALWNEEATEEETLEAYQRAIDTGDAWGLEGFIGRTAMSLIEGGQLILGPRPVRDYYGNLVPAWWMVDPGTKGSPEYAGRERPPEPSDEEKDRLAEEAGLTKVSYLD